MDTLSHDMRYAVRSLRRTPGFTISVLLILALGIGVSAAMFTIFKTVLVDRLPIADQERVVIMHPLDRSGRHLDVPESYLPQIARDSMLIRGVAGASHLVYPEPFMNGDALVNLGIAGVSANYFDVLGMRPTLGRLLRPEDGRAGAPLVVVLSYAAWRGKFAGDPAVIGRSLVWLPDVQVRIIGVAPPGLDYPSGSDVWRAIPPAASRQQVDVVARLAPNATISAARQALFALTQRVHPFAEVPEAAGQPDSWRISGVTAQAFADTLLGNSRPVIIALTSAVALLLLIACVNIGNLSLIRLLGRTREIAVRRAIGARSIDVVRLFAVENALLGTLGGALSFGIAAAALQLMRVAAPPQLPGIEALGSLATPVAAAAAISVLALLLFGVLPSFVASHVSANALLRSDSRSGAESRSGRRARQWLVAMQIALAVVMLNGAGLLVRTLAQLESVDLGYHSDHLSVLAFTASPGIAAVLPSGVTGGEVEKQLIRQLGATPGVLAATPILSEPFIGQSFYISKLARAEQPLAEREQNPFVPYEFVGPDYFRTLGIPILRGRGFSDSDIRTAEQVVVVNETLARQLWPNENALGKRVVSMAGATGDKSYTVVGVARDTHFRELRNVGPVAYFAWEQVANWFPGLIAIRTTRPLASVLPVLRAASRQVNQRLLVWKAQTMDQLLDPQLAQPRLSALLLAGFSLAALLLSAIGLYGVMAANVRRQTHEIGVRMALGATPSTIRQLVLAQLFGLVGVGLISGLPAALGASRLLQSLLFAVSPIDPLTLSGVCVLLLVVATLAGYLPARRAARIDPVEALRAE